jgi:hypothetical protein
VAVVGLFLSSSSAEARFGKRSSSSSETKREKKKSKVHEATAVGKEDSEGDDEPSPPPARSLPRASRVVVVPDPLAVAENLEALTSLISIVRSSASTTSSVSIPSDSAPSQSAPAAEVSAAPQTVESAPLMFRLGVDGAPVGGGTAVSLFLTLEGQRMGLDARGTELTLPTDDGTVGTDSITLGTVHLSYAMIAREKLRLRLEGGLSMASAPELSVAGPSFALSLEACLADPLDLELRAQGTAFPYQQLDAQAGLALNIGNLVLRGGWRGLYLNDAGLVDGVEHADAFSGPYAGLGFSF